MAAFTAIAGAAIGAAGVISSAKAASNNKKAINASTQAATESNAASIAEQRRQFDTSSANLSPFIRSGTGANSMINALLGIPMQGQNQGGTQNNFVGTNALSQPAADFGGGYGSQALFADGGYSPAAYYDSAALNPAMFSENQPQNGLPGPIGGYGGGTFNMDGTQATPVDPRQAANDAFNVFRNSTGYQFRVNEGQDAINTGYAARGLLQSGAALKGLEDYRQNTASAEFGNYLGALQGQQNVGFGAASAQAGVGQSFANNVTQLNTANANALAAGAVARANNSNALIGGIGGAIGGALGQLGGSSYASPFGAQTGISFNPNNAANIMGIGR